MSALAQGLKDTGGNDSRVRRPWGLPRHAGRILCTAMRLAVPRALNHLPDDLLHLAVEELR